MAKPWIIIFSADRLPCAQVDSGTLDEHAPPSRVPPSACLRVNRPASRRLGEGAAYLVKGLYTPSTKLLPSPCSGNVGSYASVSLYPCDVKRSAPSRATSNKSANMATLLRSGKAKAGVARASLTGCAGPARRLLTLGPEPPALGEVCLDDGALFRGDKARLELDAGLSWILQSPDFTIPRFVYVDVFFPDLPTRASKLKFLIFKQK